MMEQYAVTENEEIAAIDHELAQIQDQIRKLAGRKEVLQKRKQELKDKLMLKKSESLSTRNWQSTDYPWSKDVKKVLQEKFKIEEFRPYQLPTINAVLSKENTILIMPTGGGKSLCYQIPALVSKGFGLVISPLVSLMEDQLMTLEKLGIPAYMLSATSSKNCNKTVLAAMTDEKSPMKILYATPERLSKSKRFMSKLQKAFQVNRLCLIAIDEVHCCSQWGHDFRPDYKYLGVLSAMFPGVPILGVTATATSNVIIDVQKMLDIPGCLVLKASFNRPNLFYEVREKPLGQEMITELAFLLRNRFRGQSGIIYTTSIKDSEELSKKLREEKISAAYYHASMEAADRTQVHQKWADGKVQVIIATVAFGMGIDKADVRFVIHHALPKSMESLYQESGRAGRDGKNSDCILYFKMSDVFKLSTMVFPLQTGLENLYNVVKYCLDSTRCRRQQIAYYFGEAWESTDCNAMCDFCRNPKSTYEQDIGAHCRVLYKLIEHASNQDSKLTCQKLMDLWFNKSPVKSRMPDHKSPSISTTRAETIIGHLLVNGYLKEDFHYTPYTTLTYLKRGPMAGAASKPDHVIMARFAGASMAPTKKKEEIKKKTNKEEKIAKAEERSKTDERKKAEKRPRESSAREKVLPKSVQEEVVIDSDSDTDDDIAVLSKKKKIAIVLSDSETD